MQQLEYLAIAQATGADAGAFLQAQLSADIAALAVGEVTYACYCSPRGQVYGLLLIGRRDDDYLVVGSGELLPSIVDRLNLFKFRSKVDFKLLSENRVYGLEPGKAGPGSEVFHSTHSDLYYAISDLSRPHVGSSASFKARELSHGIAWLSPETSEKFIPQMLGFDRVGAVSFSKGCYPGQEIVARAKYLGRVKRKPVLLTLNQPVNIEAASRVELFRTDEWKSGSVIDSVSGPEGGTHVFVVAAEEGGSASQLKYGDEIYLCATM